MKLALKELRETRVWLLIIQRKIIIKSTELIMSILKENNELISIFVTSIATAKKKS
jgi:four helix bundle protein